MTKSHILVENPWRRLRDFTDARIALGRAGNSLPTHRHLDFQLAHAQARDAVMRDVDWVSLNNQIASLVPDMIALQSQAESRSHYLKRPDLGRLLDSDSIAAIKNWKHQTEKDYDTCVIVADGLSATAIETGAVSMLQELLPKLESSQCVSDFFVCTASQARVALCDEVGGLLGVRHNIILIGERPGLSSPNSLGLYYTRAKNTPYTDADRNCLSNIRPKGLSYKDAASRLLWLMESADKLGYSGVALKDGSTDVQSLAADRQRNFLTAGEISEN